MKKTSGIIAVLAQLISIVLLFIPGMFRFHKYSWVTGNPLSTVSDEFTELSFFSFMNRIIAPDTLMTVLIVLLFLTLLYNCLSLAIKNKYTESKFFILLPLSQVVLFVIIAVMISNASDVNEGLLLTQAFNAKTWHLFYPELGLLIISLIFCIVEKVSKESNHSKNNNQQFSIADELKKYKDLFDSGAINQEEFEKKKKELLNKQV